MAKTKLNGCIVIGGSAGSLQVILHLLFELDINFALPVVIVLHRKPDHNSSLVEVLNHKSKLSVKEADDKESIKAGRVYLAPADYHLLIEKDRSFSLDASEKIYFSRPSIDATFQTAAEAFGASLTAIILSGANADGTAGLQTVRKYNGTAIIQDPGEVEVAYMPQAAIESGVSGQVLSLHEIVTYLKKKMSEDFRA